jgi:leucyl aminopeptidase
MINLSINSITFSETIIVPLFETETIKEDLFVWANIIGFTNWDYFQDFKCKPKEQLLWIADSGQKVYFLGLGSKKVGHEIKKIFRSFFYHKAENDLSNVSIHLSHQSLQEFAGDISQGVFLGKYRLGALKQEKPKGNWFDSDKNLSFKFEEASSLLPKIEKGRALAETQIKMMSWVDAPANYKTPEILAKEILKSGEKNGFKVTVFDDLSCEQMGLKALMSVGKGSVENPPKFVVMEYTHPEATKRVGLIGKGVTFDTGGVSLKPGDNMNYMKSDMGGAAAVVGAMELAARLGLKINVVGAVPLTENCIDSLAIKPGDVIGSYLGKTIEVINTDAEGRLILADAIAYVNKNFQPEVMIDLATLTGNCIMALGYAASAMLTNNEELAESIYAAGQKTGEKTWRLPLWEDYKDMMKSDVADIKNLSTAPVAGAITAAKFLEEFTENHPKWAHLDIAGVAFGDSEYGSMKSSTAYGVALLTEWMEEFAKQ